MITESGSALYLGPITRIRKKHFGQYCYDAAGKWEFEYKLKYSDILKMEIHSKYASYFNTFMKRFNPFKYPD